MQRKRGSSGLCWKPHLMSGLTLDKGVCSGVTSLGAVGLLMYESSVGTLSLVMPLPPGQLCRQHQLEVLR